MKCPFLKWLWVLRLIRHIQGILWRFLVLFKLLRAWNAGNTIVWWVSLIWVSLFIGHIDCQLVYFFRRFLKALLAVINISCWWFSQFFVGFNHLWDILQMRLLLPGALFERVTEPLNFIEGFAILHLLSNDAFNYIKVFTDLLWVHGLVQYKD